MIMLLQCLAWLLAFIFLSTVAGVPVSPTNLTTTSSPGITTPSGAGVLHPNASRTTNVSATSLNNTQNAANTSVSTGLKGPNNESAETMEELTHGEATEGDILPGTDRNAAQTVWPGAVIPYTISRELASRKMEIEEAFGMIMSVTCIRFTQHTNEINYIEIKDGQGCASFVGSRGGAQPVYFSSTCSAGNLCHELLHAAGLYHEHTRHDRDKHVIVNWERIRPDRKSNFDVKEGNTLNLPYDLDSIMHYGPNFFSVDGGQTLQPKQPGVEIGQRNHLSRLDVSKLNKLYRCGK